jgi:tRNA A-37 threonylcarbamoyl transferase component Bud32
MVRMPRFLAAQPVTQLISLPWATPLEDWPEDQLVALPRGISRHVVRFVRCGREVFAVKEVLEHLAMHEYRLLRDLTRLDVPSVEAIGVVTSRVDTDGELLDPILITRHLQFSLPYRSLFSRGVRQDTVNRLVDAMVVLLARLHLTGFLWGDVSLSNTLFRRDAGAFAAYLVDAETGELHDQLTAGQREHDLTIARTNLYGEFSDLEAGGLLDEALDPLILVETIESRYRELWAELTDVEEFDTREMHRIEGRVRRLNALGFDVAELDIATDFAGSTVRIQPKVVDAGHHQRRLIRLTGLDTEENQARRLLNDLDYYRARTDQQGADEQVVAHQWLTRVFEPVVESVPEEMRAKLEPAELYHEVLEHRWFLSEQAGKEIPITEAAQSYMNTVLHGLPDEEVALSAIESMGPLANPYDPSQGFAEEDYEKPYDPWEDADEAPDAEEPPATEYLDIAALRAKAKR